MIEVILIIAVQAVAAFAAFLAETYLGDGWLRYSIIGALYVAILPVITGAALARFIVEEVAGRRGLD